MTDAPKKSKVVSLSGAPMTPEEATEPEDVREAREAKQQLAHWAPQAARYVALIELDCGKISFCSSSERAGDVLAMANLLWRLAQDHAMEDLTGEQPVYREPA